MAVDTIVGYDATGGGTLAVISPTSLTIKGSSQKDRYLLGYWYDGISANDLTITCTTNPEWEAAGITLPPTSDGTATSAGLQYRLFGHKIPVKGGDVMTLAATSGANPVMAGLFVEYPELEPTFQPRQVDQQEGVAHYVSKSTTAGGTNCAAGTFVQGATNITGFMEGRTYTPLIVNANAAFTTTAVLGMRKLGGNSLFAVPIPLTDVAADWMIKPLPKGLFTVSKGDAIEVFWSSVTAEQPTANVTFVY